MGCDYYNVNGQNLHFSEVDDEISCLCTFPYNNHGKLDKSDLFSLAILGAATVLATRNKLKHNILPRCVDKWILDELNRLIG